MQSIRARRNMGLGFKGVAQEMSETSRKNQNPLLHTYIPAASIAYRIQTASTPQVFQWSTLGSSVRALLFRPELAAGNAAMELSTTAGEKVQIDVCLGTFGSL